MYGMFCGADALALVAHVSLLSFLRLRKVFVDIIDCDEGRVQVVAVVDDFEPCGFGGKIEAT